MSVRRPHRGVVVGVDGSPSSTMTCGAAREATLSSLASVAKHPRREFAAARVKSLVRDCGRLDGVDVSSRGLEELTCQI